MIQVGAKAMHVPSGRECLVVFRVDKEPKYTIRFPNMRSVVVYSVELEELEKEEPLLASEPIVGEILIGAESMQIKSKIGIKEEMSSKEEIKINKDVKK